MDEQVKDPTTVDEQIRILSERGMQVDIDLARQCSNKAQFTFQLQTITLHSTVRMKTQVRPTIPIIRKRQSFYSALIKQRG